MAKHQLPAGCHDAESAAQLLGMSKKALLKKMRELGWLNVGGGPGNHNLPRRELTACGYLFTQERGYCLKGKREIAKTYSVMLLSQTGFVALKKLLEAPTMQKEPPKSSAPALTQTARALPESEEKVIPFDQEAAEQERKKIMEQFRAWGIAS